MSRKKPIPGRKSFPIKKHELDLVMSFPTAEHAASALNISLAKAKRIRHDKENTRLSWDTKLWLKMTSATTRHRYLERYLMRIAPFNYGNIVFQRLNALARIVEQYDGVFHFTTKRQGNLDQPRTEFKMMDDAIRTARRLLKKAYFGCPTLRERIFHDTKLPEVFEQEQGDNNDDDNS